MPEACDVVVLGGGPAGSTVATLVAREGHHVVLLEREHFPRFKVGESLMPETYWTLDKLGMLDALRESASPVKASVQFISASGRASRPFYFFERRAHESSYTWQVERAWFDRAMLDNAETSGVSVHPGTSVRDVVFDNGRATGVRASREGGELQTVRSRVVVDATGLGSLISHQLQLRKRDPKLGRASVYAHFENGLRDSGIDEGATVIVHAPENRGWFWYIPLSGNRVSVGVVAFPQELFSEHRDPESALARALSSCPEMIRRLEAATQVSPARVVKDYSYRASRVAGDGWVLVGDAFGFLDPIYSSGVFLALKSGEMAAETISDALTAGECSAERLGTFGPRLTRGMEALKKLVYAFYTPGFSFSRFVREHPHHQRALVDLLVGDVFEKSFEKMFADLGASLTGSRRSNMTGS